MLTPSLPTIIFIALLLTATTSLIIWSVRLGITPTPTSPKVCKKLGLFLPDTVQGDIQELGSGWGNLLPLLYKRYPRNNLIAYERSLIPRIFSRVLCQAIGVKANIKNQNIFDADLSQSGLVICYLYPKAMEQLSTHLALNLPEHCWVISHTFHLPGWKPIKQLQANDLYKTPIYLYQKSYSKNS